MGGSGGIVLGLDLGGTKVLAGVVDGEGRVAGRGKLKTPFAGDAGHLTDALVGAADGALAEAGLARKDVRAIGIGAPGPVDAAAGVLVRAPNLAVSGYDFGRSLASAFPAVPVRLLNDVRAAGLAEARLGAARGRRLVVAIWVGTGIGGAVLLDGEVWTGRNQNAGEIGHVYLDLKGARPAGEGGTLERIGAKVGMTQYLKRRIEAGSATVLAEAVTKKGGRLKGKDLVRALDAGDRLARRAVERSARAVGLTIANVWNLLAPDLFVVGGGVAQDLGDRYLGPVRETALSHAFFTELGAPEVVPAALGDDAGLLGAALAAREALGAGRTAGDGPV